MPSLSLQFLEPLTRKIATTTLDPIARASGFLRRCSKKITPQNFLLTCCLFGLQNHCSLSCFAQLWALLQQQHLSKQAVQKRFSARAVHFLQAVLQSILASLVIPAPGIPAGIRHRFKRVLLQDSTCLALPPKLAALFPGATNQTHAPQAGLKIQATLDLLKHQWLAFHLTPFVVNDQKASGEILAQAQPGDLIIRDLGYLVLEVLQKIQHLGAYFLSRWRYGIAVLCPQSGSKLPLLKLLQQSGPLWESQVELGRQRLPARLIALRLPDSVANARRHKARRNRDRRLNHNEEYFQLLGWNIFITNVPPTMLDPKALVELYSLRWRIETIFKAWKSHFRLEQLTEVSAEQLLVVILSKLIWICWFSVHWTTLVSQGAPISLLKLAQWWSKFAVPLILSAQKNKLPQLKRQLLYYCRYDKRKDRLNFLQKCAGLG
jgi:hypothetical protein